MTLTKQDLISIGEIVDQKLDHRFKEQDTKIDQKLDQRFTEQDTKLDQKLKDTKNSLLDVMRRNNEHLIRVINENTDKKIDRGILSLKVLIENLESKMVLFAEGHDAHFEKLQQHGATLNKHENDIQTLNDFVFTPRKNL
ncbi:MAG: hypothetical protein A3B70_08475 [Deltaproteobacteria bacterium RIFCSPHIGHO2_02_FULL_40_11]|nr:MAG: hypothetical protein A3B70_08475 [Deltaproteobacteria bacterium RIFCSPHIGHO2_02_FULL_40_11]